MNSRPRQPSTLSACHISSCPWHCTAIQMRTATAHLTQETHNAIELAVAAHHIQERRHNEHQRPLRADFDDRARQRQRVAQHNLRLPAAEQRVARNDREVLAAAVLLADIVLHTVSSSSRMHETSFFLWPQQADDGMTSFGRRRGMRAVNEHHGWRHSLAPPAVKYCW